MVNWSFCLFIVNNFKIILFRIYLFKNNIILIKRLCGEEPFKAENDEELYKKIFKASYSTSSHNYEILSANAKDFLMRLLTVDPKKRMTVHQALANSWLLGKATKMDNLSTALDTMRVIVNKKKTQVENLKFKK